MHTVNVEKGSPPIQIEPLRQLSSETLESYRAQDTP